MSGLIIATYAMLADRAWCYHGSPVQQQPELDRIGAGYALRAQELPSDDEFTVARERVAKLFGVHVPAVLLTRNLTRLAGEAHAKVADLEPAVNGVRRSLDRHAGVLGLPSQAPRVTTGRCAADLLARLSGPQDATSLVRALAGASYPMTDEVLGAAISSAPAVLAALDQADWTLLESVRGFTGRGDGLGDQSERLVEEVAQAAADDEFTRPLAPVLCGMRDRAVALINEAARLARVAPPRPSPTPPGPEEPLAAETGAQADSGRPARSSLRVQSSQVETALAQIIADLQSEIWDYAAANPGVEIEIRWHPVDTDS